VVIRAVGLANMKNAPVLDIYLGDVVQQDVTMVCIDLSACAGMDSTFMGLLVGRSQQMTAKGGRLVVVNPTVNGQRLLAMLGLDQVIPVLECVQQADLRFVTLETTEFIPPRGRLELIKRAHEDLANLNDANQGKFAAFLQALQRDLAKLDDPKPKSDLKPQDGPGPQTDPVIQDEPKSKDSPKDIADK
jgi:anti-anti-sigma factor